MINQWNFMRLLRAGLAVWAFVELYNTGEWLLLFPGIIFGMQAVLNVGCCGSGACYAPPEQRAATDSDNTVIAEEIR